VHIRLPAPDALQFHHGTRSVRDGHWGVHLSLFDAVAAHVVQVAVVLLVARGGGGGLAHLFNLVVDGSGGGGGWVAGNGGGSDGRGLSKRYDWLHTHMGIKCHNRHKKFRQKTGFQIMVRN
jgi:hypothetical protein